MVGASTEIVKIGIIPQTNSQCVCDTWTITDFIGLDNQVFTQMEVIIMLLESKNTGNISTGHKETVNDISFLLHKHLH